MEETEAKIQIFFNNIQGFGNKRSYFIQSELAERFNLYIFQEARIKKNDLTKYRSDLGSTGLESIVLAYDTPKTYIRGTLLAYNGQDIIVEECANLADQNFEISAIRVSSKLNYDSFYIFSMYKSPSIHTIPANDEIFSRFCDFCNSFGGKKILLGDWNISKGRNVIGRDEGRYLKMIEDNCGVKSRFREPTRGDNQLDYVMSNFDLDCWLEPGLAGTDHRAIGCEVDLTYQVEVLPPIWIRKSKAMKIDHLDFLTRRAFDIMMEEYPELDTSAAILEMELLIVELTDMLSPGSYLLPERRVIPGLSRQQSAVFLDREMPISEKIAEQKKLQRLDFNRKFSAKMTNPRKLVQIREPLMLPPKKGKPTASVPASDLFADDVLKDEALCNHEHHPDWSGKNADLIGPMSEESFAMILNNMAKKWKKFYNFGFSEDFWHWIGKKLMSDQDTGCPSFSYVTLVKKDASKLDEVAGWRLVWEPASGFEKLFDMLKATLIKAEKVPNHAYRNGRSTQSCLAAVSCWRVDQRHVLLGCDFKKAFNLQCRICTNKSFNYKIVPDSISFQVNNGNECSRNCVSLVGTGAGRASGGVVFNAATFGYLRTREISNEALQKGALQKYADDSQKLVRLDKKAITDHVNDFLGASDIGLSMHRIGKKGPTLLVHEKQMDEAMELAQTLEYDLNVMTKVKFLGVDLVVDRNWQAVYAELASGQRSFLAFHSYQLVQTMMMSRQLSQSMQWRVFWNASQAVAAFLESRIQYSIFFIGQDDLRFMYSMHVRIVCGLLGVPASFFGFRSLAPRNRKSQYVIDLSKELRELQSASYVRICNILGRPTLCQMAVRAYSVIASQISLAEMMACNTAGSSRSGRPTEAFCAFLKKFKGFKKFVESSNLRNVKPTSNKWFNAFKKIKIAKSRRLFAISACDRILRCQLSDRGYQVDDKNCRICLEQGLEVEEDMRHMVTVHKPDNVKFDGDSLLNYAWIASEGGDTEGRIESALWLSEKFNLQIPNYRKISKNLNTN